jgi:hypothetical protein
MKQNCVSLSLATLNTATMVGGRKGLDDGWLVRPPLVFMQRLAYGQIQQREKDQVTRV